MKNFKSWLNNIKKTTIKVKAQNDKQQKKDEAARYTFEKYIKENGETLVENIIEELKPNIEEAAKEGKSYLVFSNCYWGAGMMPSPECFQKAQNFVQDKFKYYKYDCDENLVGDNIPRFRGPSKYDWEKELKPYFNKIGFHFGVNVDTYGLFKEFYITW